MFFIRNKKNQKPEKCSQERLHSSTTTGGAKSNERSIMYVLCKSNEITHRMTGGQRTQKRKSTSRTRTDWIIGSTLGHGLGFQGICAFSFASSGSIQRNASWAIECACVSNGWKEHWLALRVSDGDITVLLDSSSTEQTKVSTRDL